MSHIDIVTSIDQRLTEAKAEIVRLEGPLRVIGFQGKPQASSPAINLRCGRFCEVASLFTCRRSQTASMCCSYSSWSMPSTPCSAHSFRMCSGVRMQFM